jgi:hypothetical protein
MCKQMVLIMLTKEGDAWLQADAKSDSQQLDDMQLKRLLSKLNHSCYQ